MIAHRGRLAGAVRPEEAGHDARLDRERDVVDGREGAVALGEAFDCDHATSLREPDEPPHRARGQISPSTKVASAPTLVGGVELGTRDLRSTGDRRDPSALPARLPPMPPMPLTRWQQTWRNLVAIGFGAIVAGSRSAGPASGSRRPGVLVPRRRPRRRCRSSRMQFRAAGRSPSRWSPRSARPPSATADRRRRSSAYVSLSTRRRWPEIVPVGLVSVDLRPGVFVDPAGPDRTRGTATSLFGARRSSSSPRSACTSAPAATCSPRCRTGPSGPSASRQLQVATRAGRTSAPASPARCTTCSPTGCRWSPCTPARSPTATDLTPEETARRRRDHPGQLARAPSTDLREILGVLRDTERERRRDRAPAAADARRPRRPARRRARGRRRRHAARRPRGPRRAAAVDRPQRLPDRAGGPDQRPQARAARRGRASSSTGAPASGLERRGPQPGAGRSAARRRRRRRVRVCRAGRAGRRQPRPLRARPHPRRRLRRPGLATVGARDRGAGRHPAWSSSTTTRWCGPGWR